MFSYESFPVGGFYSSTWLKLFFKVSLINLVMELWNDIFAIHKVVAATKSSYDTNIGFESKVGKNYSRTGLNKH